MRYIIFIILFFVVTTPLCAQELSPLLAQRSSDSLPPAITVKHFEAPLPIADTTTRPTVFQARGQVDWTKFAISTGVLGVSFLGLHVLQNNAWWANQRGSFHVLDDPTYKDNFDKFGHTFGAYYTSHFFDEMYTWSGFDSAQSTLLGALSGAMYEFYVEIEDGFARDWGFSPGDAKADVLGATFFVLRNRIDFLRNFQYKWLYFPSSQILNGKADIQDQTLNPLDDYGGQTYWVTMDVNRMLPTSAKEYWPKWLNLALGFGGWNLDAPPVDGNPNPFVNRKKAYYLGFDFEIEKIIPESSIGILNFVRRALGYWHLPAPAYRISPDPRFFILFPLRMTIG